MGFPINDINNRLQLGFKEVPWGNTSWKALNQAPAENLMDNEPADNSGDGNITDVPDDDADTSKKPTDTDADDTDDDAVKGRDLLYRRYIETQAPVEKLIEGKLKKFVFEQRKKVLGLPVYSEEIFNKVFEAEEKRLITLFTPLYTIAMKTGYTMLQEEVSGELEFPEEDRNFQTYLENRLKFIPKRIIRTMKKMVLASIGSDKKPAPEVQGRLRIVYNSISSRCLTIARTESANIISGARVLAMVMSGFNYHQWVSFTKTRDGHSSLDGKIVKIGKSFKPEVTLRFPGDMMAPAGEVIGCRCFTIPIKI